jgi:ElaB/YqjD/DUF883 family membrane-anchored ribosome-binding protein
MTKIGQSAIEEVKALAKTLESIVDATGCNNASNATKRLIKQNEEVAELKDQIARICEALEVDNWYNAIKKAKKLVSGQE